MSAAEPEGADIEHQGLGWASTFESGMAGHTITSGIEGAWKPHPTKWDNGYLDTLFGYEWELTKSPAGAHQWKPKGNAGAGTVEDAHDPKKKHQPMMTTADMALRMDPAYEKIARRFQKNPQEFAEAFAKAWYKLTHRDMGPHQLYRGKLVPKEPLIWQDPIPAVDHPLIGEQDIAALEGEDPRFRPVGVATGFDRLGVGVNLPRVRTSAAAPMARVFASRRKRIGRSTTRPSWRRCCRSSKPSRRSSMLRPPAARKSRSPT